jgi:hypothetical protein
MINYSIKKIKSDEFYLLIPLMKNCFGASVNIEYFVWKYVNNPSGFVEGFIALSETNEIAAFYGVIPEVYIIEGKKTTIFQSCDTMTHSNHRRKGLFQKLALHCYEHLKNENKLFIIGFGGGQSTPGFLKFGWIRLFYVKFYFYPKIFSLFKSYSSDRIKKIEDVSLIEGLILKSNNLSVIHSHKTLENFKWRISNPNYNYKILAHQTSEFIYNSFLCYYIMDDKIVLFDFYFENLKTGKLLVGQLKNQLSNSKYKGIIMFCQENSVFSRSVSKLGFISNPFSKGPLSIKVPFIFYANKEELNTYNAKHKWLVNSFDHDAM